MRVHIRNVVHRLDRSGFIKDWIVKKNKATTKITPSRITSRPMPRVRFLSSGKRENPEYINNPVKNTLAMTAIWIVIHVFVM